MSVVNRLLATSLLCSAAHCCAHAQNTWAPVADAGTNDRHLGVGFVIGSSGYMGLGSSVSLTPMADFWELNGGVWTQRADFEGGPTLGASAFSISGQGYVVCGIDNSTTTTKEVWQYDPGTNDWVSKDDFPGTKRYLGAAFVIGTKGYFGTGKDDLGNKLKDFWEYDPTGDSWTQKNDLGGVARYAATGFNVETSGYILTGIDPSDNELKDVWKFDPTANTWAQKTDFPGNARSGAVSFSIGVSGFIATGEDDGSYYADLWQYYPGIDYWVQRTSYTGTARYGALGFNLSGKGLLGTGRDVSGVHKDYYEYTPHPLSIAVPLTGSVCAGSSGAIGYSSSGITFTGGNAFTVQLSNSSGSFVSPVNIGSLTTTTSGGSINYTIPLGTTAGSGYRLRVVASSPTITGADNGTNITITSGVAASVTIGVAPGSTICSGSPVTFTATPVNGGGAPTYQWKKNGANVGTNSATLIHSSLANGDVIECWMTSNATCASPVPVTSNQITMTVNPILATAVSIGVSPGSQLCNITSATFTATPTNGGPSPTYEWKRNNITVGTNSTTYSPTDLVDGDVIKCFMTSNATCGTPVSSESNSITISVLAIVTPSVSIDGPGPVCGGTNVTLTAVPVHGGATPTFQWKKNGNVVATNSITYQDATLANADDITVEMTTSRTCVTSTTANASYVMNVTPSVTPTVTINTSPGTSIPANTKVFMTTDITNGGTSPTFEWKVDGVSQGTASKLVIAQPLDGSSVACTLISNATCAASTNVTSTPVVLVVDAGMTRDHHSWEQEPGYPNAATNPRFYPAGFFANGKYYVTTGMSGAGADMKDTWEFNPSSGVWTQKSDFGGTARHGAIGFSVNNKGYITTGLTTSGTVYKKDIWEYDPLSNNWFARADLPGVARKGAVGFVVGTKIYVGSGYNGDPNGLSDFYEYNTLTNSWTSVTSMPGGGRFAANSFAIGTNGYVLGGIKAGPVLQNDLWEYNSATNQWTERAAYPGGERRDMVAFASGGYGFAGGGSASISNTVDQRTDFWQYAPGTNTWTREQDFEGYLTGNDRPVAGVNNGKAYVFTGSLLHEFSTLTLGTIKNFACQGEVLQIPFNATGLGAAAGNVYSVQLSLVESFATLTNVGTLSSTANGGVIPSTIPLVLSGNIFLRVVSSNPASTSPLEKLQISVVNRSLSISATPNNVCQGTPITFRSSLGASQGTYQWTKNAVNVGADSEEYTDATLTATDVVKLVLTYNDVCSNPLAVSSNNLSVTLKTAPKPTVAISGNTLTSSLAVGYQWFKSDNPVAAATNQTLIISESGNYKVRITATNGCTSDSDVLTAVFTSIDAALENGIRFYPNPFVHNLEFDASALASVGGSADVSMVNELGQIVFTRSKLRTLERFNLENLPAGLYFLKVDDGTTVSVRRVVKLK